MSLHKLRSVINLYKENANFWNKKRAKNSFFEKVYIDWILQNVPAESQILDLGCGTEFPISNYLLQNKMKVTGVDATSEMLEFARKKINSADWICADMRTLKLNKTFNAIIAWDSFFHLNHEDQKKMMTVFKKHLVQAGVLVFTTGVQYGEAIRDMNKNPLFHASFSIEEYKTILENSGFTINQLKIEDPNCGFHTVWCCTKTS